MGEHHGLAYVDSFHRERAIALTSGLFSWDDVWDSGAEIVVTMAAADSMLVSPSHASFTRGTARLCEK